MYMFESSLSRSQVAEDRRRQHELRVLKERDALAKRLRYVANNKSVDVPTLPEGMQYHIFLSHIWSSGQDQMRVIRERLLMHIPDLKIFLDVRHSRRSRSRATDLGVVVSPCRHIIILPRPACFLRLLSC